VKLASHLRRSRHGVFYFRIVFPQILATILGQPELNRSLFTRCPKTARLTGYQLSGTMLPLISKLARLMTIDPESLDPASIKELIVEGLTVGKDGGFSVARIQTHDDPQIAQEELKNFALLLHARREGQLAPPPVTEAVKIEAQKLKSEITQFSAALPTKPSALKDAFDSYLLSKKGIAAATKKSYTESLELFGVLMGGDHRMVHEITRLECTDFNEALSHIPLHAKKRNIKIGTASEILLNPPTVLDENGDAVPPETISARTCNDHLTNVSGFFSWAIKAGRCFEPNPFEDSVRHSDGEIDGGAEAFLQEELIKIFDSKNFMKAKRPHQFWGPLLLLFTGARANEIACLDLDDVITENGIPCISIKHRPRKKPDTIEHKIETKRVKNSQSRRTIPLHPKLWEIGFGEYLGDLKSLGATRIFPNLPMDSREKRERNLSRDVNNYLKEVGVHIPRTKVLHSFRDTVSDALGTSDLDAVRADQWTGHAPVGIKAKHYRSKAPADIQARDAFSALDFPFIRFDELKYKKGRWNEWLVNNMVP
jgi:integrase